MYTINHKRDAASKPKRRTTADEDEDDAADDTEGLPPQVLTGADYSQLLPPPCQHRSRG